MKTIEEVIKNKAFIISSLDEQHDEPIDIYSFSPMISTTNIKFKRDIVIDNSTILFKILKPFIYYSFSMTIKELPERCTPLINKHSF